jgi:carboxypeptidase D
MKLPTKQELKVESIPSSSVNLDSYAGQIPINDQSSYFFWMFKSIKPENDVLLFWFNGGPGCSSMDGALLENGPLRFNGDNLVLNQFGWNNAASVVYVDQPVGTGYSVTGEPLTSNSAVVDYFRIFLDNFLQIFDEYSDSRIFLAGESYAVSFVYQGNVDTLFCKKYFGNESRPSIKCNL